MTASLSLVSPASPQATNAWQRSTERSLDHLLSALERVLVLDESAIDVGFASVQIREGLAQLFVAQREDEDPAVALPLVVTAVDRCIATIAVARSTEPAVELLYAELRQARDAAAAASDQARAVLYRGPAPTEPFRASSGTLRVHARFASAVVPAEPANTDLPPEPPAEKAPPPPTPDVANPSDLAAALAALAARAAARKAPPESTPTPTEQSRDEAPAALGIDAWRAVRAKECLAEVAMLLSHRTPQLGEVWHSVRPFEERIIANVDAIAGLGPRATQELEQSVLSAPAPDIFGAAALALTCGSVDGRDSLALAESVYRRMEQSAELDEAFFDALALTCHPALPAYCERLLDGEPSEARRVHALRLLGRQGLAHPGHVLRGLGDAPRVHAEALPLHAYSNPPDLRERIDDALAVGHDALTVAAWRAMVIGGDLRANLYLREALGGHLREEAGLLLALTAEKRDAEHLWEHVATGPTPGLLTALGFGGLVDSVPLLIGLLDVDDFALKLASARALTRITGWELVEPVELPAEMVAGEEPAAKSSGGQRLDDEISDPRDPVPAGSPDTIELPTLRRQPWQDAWVHYGGNFDPSLRYRRGRPSTPEVILDELAYARATPDERVACVLEIGIRSGRPVHFDTRTWVAAQLAALGAWRASLMGVGVPGSWVAPRRSF